MKFRRLIALCIAVIMVFSMSACNGSTDNGGKGSGNKHVVTDIMGREVEIPDGISRIAAMNGPSYEMVFCLGGADRVVMVKKNQTSNYPVALLANPDLANYDGLNNVSPSAVVNIEEYLSRNIDLVLYYNNATELKKFEDVGIPAVVLTLSASDISSLDACLALSLDEYKTRNARGMKVLSEVLGGDAIAKYEKWEKYTSDLIDLMYERTKDLKDEDRVTLYWGNTWGENLLSSYLITNRAYEINLAGGKLLGPTTGGNFPEINEEQLFDWDPEVILIDNHGNSPDLVKDFVMTNSKWSTLKAVETKRVYRIPAGVFFMDKGSTTALMTLWVATIIQPELFSDINMIEELQKYYKEFYEFDLSEENAQKILDGWYYSSGEPNE